MRRKTRVQNILTKLIPLQISYNGNLVAPPMDIWRSSQTILPYLKTKAEGDFHVFTPEGNRTWTKRLPPLGLLTHSKYGGHTTPPLGWCVAHVTECPSSHFIFLFDVFWVPTLGVLAESRPQMFRV